MKKNNNKIQYSNTNRNTDWLTSPQLRPLQYSRTTLIGGWGVRKTLDRTQCACVCVTGNNSSSISCLSFCSIISFLFASACANVQWWSTHTDTHSHCWDVSIEVALMCGGFFCPGRDRDRGMEREGNRWIVSQHSAFVSAP